MNQRPRILLFTGDGKGKTTAALGMALRAAGHGMEVLVLQFVKQDGNTGEIAASERLDTVEIVQTGLGFVPAVDAPKFAEHRAAAQAGLAKAREAIVSGDYALVVLDEICVAVARELVEERDVLELLGAAPPEMCVVMTGRGATGAMIEAADTVTEMQCVKHAMETGRRAENGVEL